MSSLEGFSRGRISIAAPRSATTTVSAGLESTNHPAIKQHRTEIDLHYLEWGSRGAPPVILLHGNSAHAHWWDFVAPQLASSYRVIALDLRGHGESSWVTPPAYQIQDYVADLRQFIMAMRLDFPALIGHSLGGYIALSFAAREQVELRALAAVDTNPVVGDGNGAFLARLRGFRHPRYADLDEACRRFRPVPRGTRARPEVISHVASLGVRRAPQGHWEPKFHREAFASHPYTDIRPSLAAIDCPVLFIRGSESKFVSRQTAAGMAALCRQAALLEVEGAEHHVLLDQPDRLAAAISRFLEQANER